MKGVFFESKENLIIREDLEKPSISPQEVLVKVKYCGICGSDIESYKTGTLEKPGIIIGHEFSGEIVEIGKEVKGWNERDRVAVNPSLPCNSCYWCNHSQENLCKWSSALGTTFNGAMAEYVKVNAERLIKLPESVSFEEGALLEPLAVALYAVQESNFNVGENATVIGAGSIGLSTIQVLNAAGATDIFVLEPVESKQSLAMELGATEVFDPDKWGKINRLTNRIGPEYVFDSVGIPDTLMTSLQLVKRGGYIIVVGLYTEPFEIKGFMSLMLKNITMRGMYGYVQDTFLTALNLVKNNQVDVTPLISQKVKIDTVPELFKDLAKRKHEDIKVLVEI